MRILFLPNNIASIPSITAEAMNGLPGMEAVCIAGSLNKYQSLQKHTVFIPRPGSKRRPFQWLWAKLTYKRRLMKWIRWADVLHYVWGPGLDGGQDLRYARRLGKKIFVEWVGSDIRNPDILLPINPYYRAVWDAGYEYRHLESAEASLATQRLFAAAGAVPLYFPEMKLFIQEALFTKTQLVQQRINCADYAPRYPDAAKKKPVIVHSPSAKVGKGSDYIITALERLKRRYDFEFVLLHGMTRAKVLSIMQHADLFIDQIIGGGFGQAALEAMSFGKPVFAYIMPQVFEDGLSRDCPVVNVNPDTIESILEAYLADGALRHATGKQSRAYIEQHHDARKVAAQLVSIYNEPAAP